MAKIAKKSKTIKIIERIVLGTAAVILLMCLGSFVYGIYESLTSYNLTGHININGEKYAPYDFVYSKKGEKVGEYKKNPVYAVVDDPAQNNLVLEYTDGYEETFVKKDGFARDTESEPSAAFIYHDKFTDSELLQLLGRLPTYKNFPDQMRLTADSLDGFLPVWIGRGSEKVGYENLGYLGKVNNRWVFVKANGGIDYIMEADHSAVKEYELFCNFLPDDYAKIIDLAENGFFRNWPSYDMYGKDNIEQ